MLRFLRRALLRRLVDRWPSPSRDLARKRSMDAESWRVHYFNQRYDSTVARGIPEAFRDRDVLEIGTGLGPVATFLARNGARRVVGIDLNRDDMVAGARILDARGGERPQFALANAHTLPFADASFDLVIADNVYEHFDDPAGVSREVHRVLRPGGKLYVPAFSSILSKYGAHMKTYIKVPWCNLLFTERVVVEVLAELAKETPRILDDYPALAERPLPRRIREVRKHKDLNSITFAAFKRMAAETGFRVDSFAISFANFERVGRLAARLRVPLLPDVLSLQAAVRMSKL